ncbi:aliphatic sulfonate ABC transporter substrate-binding protein [Roseateles violae]|uniref:Aliphatic sulfonate ABC transporter substrate-binding protein n=1 Tax=Roseateles violae TaxID=3058042 RepID=A0ABT8DLI0_9BURK|nr:aliphatic sulfonate ABC transporter substrate-binding protein [Pelomonas sp. PFR6]MDN3919271.1 aliphatic sulfonate ABC transporter substrate-binding protein [Pelomonas sp. PFR6]
MSATIFQLRHAAERRAALRVLALTAASWLGHGSVRAQGSPNAAAPKAGPLRIGFQKGSINLVLAKSLGLLEKRFPAGSVSWIEFPAGPQLLEALAVGSIDFGATGDSPPVFAQAAGKDLFYVGAEPPKPDSSALLVRPDSPLKTLADLKGRRIALQKGSSAHFLLVQAVRRGGLAWGEIQPVYLAPADARAAFERGSVDAWAIWDPYYAAAEIDSPVRVLATSRGLTNNNSFYLASRGLAGNEAALRELFAALTEADRYLQTQRKDAAQRFVQFSGLDPATVQRVLERRPPSPVGPLTAELVREQQQVADAFTQLGLIPKTLQVAEIVWRPGQSLVAQR